MMPAKLVVRMPSTVMKVLNHARMEPASITVAMALASTTNTSLPGRHENAASNRLVSDSDAL